jgi:uncharacterized protein YwgA
LLLYLRRIVFWLCERCSSKANKLGLRGKRGTVDIVSKEDWTLLAVALADGKPLSPVQLQKTVFLFGKLLPEEVLPKSYYNFSPYNYGPFCVDVYRDAESLAEAGLADIGATSHGYAEYTATTRGIVKGQEVASRLPQEAASYAAAIVEWVRKQSFSQLVSAVYEEFPEYKVNSVFAD